MSAFDLNEGEAFEIRRYAMALAQRQMEALRLYQPMPIQKAFHESMAKERIVRGGNRSGKTLSAAAEVSMIVTGQDPLARCTKENGVCYCVGFDGRHIGQVMWKKLGKPNAFKIIRDKITNQWRPYYQTMPEDAARIRDAKPAPPFIPRRCIKEIAWELKKEGQPKIVYLTNGWEIHFFSGNAKPPMGTEVDLAWFDEEIPDGEWYSEIAARLVDRSGHFIWSATPQAGTDRLYDLHERAESQREKGIYPPTVEEFLLHIDQNVHMTDQQKSEFKEKLSEDDLDVRVEGEFSRIHKVFPEYNPRVHEIPFREIPPHWTRYVAVDPGRQRGAALFMAVSPPDEGDIVILYDEIYIKECDAYQFAEAMRIKCADQQFRVFLIDDNEGSKHETGSGLTINYQYTNQMKRVGVRSELSGHGFLAGDDNVRAGIESIRSLLRKKSYGTVPRLRVMVDKVPNFVWEMKRYQYKKEAGRVTEKPRDKNAHLIDCLRYLAQHQPRWYPARKREAIEGPAYKAFQRKRAKANETIGGTSSWGPRGS